MRQDYLFLIDYGRLLALAVARSPDLKTMTRLAELLTAVLQTGMGLHRSYVAEFGMGHEELEREPEAPTTQGYTDFLLRVAALGDFAELIAALLPCMWGAGNSCCSKREDFIRRKGLAVCLKPLPLS